MDVKDLGSSSALSRVFKTLFLVYSPKTLKLSGKKIPDVRSWVQILVPTKDIFLQNLCLSVFVKSSCIGIYTLYKLEMY